MRSSVGVPIYAGFVSPAKQPRAPPAPAPTAVSSLAVAAPLDVIHSAPSPSRATQAAFLRQRSPRADPQATATNNSSSTSGVPSYSTRFSSHEPAASSASSSYAAPRAYSTSASSSASTTLEPALPSMRVRSILDDHADEDADDEATAVESEAEQRGRYGAHMPPADGSSFAPFHRQPIGQPRPPVVDASRPTACAVAPRATHTATAVSGPPTDAVMLSAVHSFLRSRYPPSVSAARPPVELTSHTLPALYALAEHVRTEEERALLVQEELDAGAHEYDAERQRLDRMLARLGVTLGALPESVQRHVESLVQLAQLLALKNTEPSSLLIGLLDARDGYRAAVDELDQTRADHEAVARQLQAEQRLNAELRALQVEMQQRAEKARRDADEKKQQVPFFRVKEQEYDRATKELTHRLQSAGFQSHLSHESLVALSHQIDQLTAQIQPLDEQLKTYQQLPPDITLARIRLAEARQQLSELEDQFSHDIRGMQDEDDM